MNLFRTAACVVLLTSLVIAFSACRLIPSLEYTPRGAGLIIDVAQDGNDAQSDPPRHPVATPARAQRAVRAALRAGEQRPIIVRLTGGLHVLDTPLVFGPEDGAVADGQVIRYESASGTPAVLSGGRAITGWKKAGNGDVWQAQVPGVREGRRAFRELFVDGQRRPRCRHPNDGFLRAEAVTDPRRELRFAAGALPPLGDSGAGAELVFLHDWSISRNEIESIDPATRLLRTRHDVGGGADFWRMNGFEPQPRFRIENRPALLDAPGEWYLDTATGMLSYRPLPGERPDRISAIAPRDGALVIIRGTPEHPVRGLVFHGIGFEYSGWQFEADRYAGGQACFHWSGPTPAADLNWSWKAIPPAVSLDHAEACTFEHCRFAHLGRSGLWLREDCHSNTVRNCTFTDIGGNGLMIGTHLPLAEEQTTAEQQVSGNEIDHCGAEYFGAVGIWIGFARNSVVQQNQIHDLPYTGISIGWKWNPDPTPCRGHRIVENNIYHVMQTLSDGGGIYTLGRQPGTILRGNWIHDIAVNAGRAESNGMFLDEGSTELLIEENLIHDVARAPLRFHKASMNEVRRNVLVCKSGEPPVRYNNTPEAAIRLNANHVVRADDWTAPERKQLIRDAEQRTAPRAR